MFLFSQVRQVETNTVEVPLASPPASYSPLSSSMPSPLPTQSMSPVTSTPFSQQSGSSAYPSSLSSYSMHNREFRSPETDDTMSIASSVSNIQSDFKIPDLWRPSVMQCINAPTPAEQKKLLTHSLRGEISRDLVTQMHAFKSKPDRAFCTTVAKLLVKKYSFMKDAGKNVSGYVSWIVLHFTRVYMYICECYTFSFTI